MYLASIRYTGVIALQATCLCCFLFSNMSVLVVCKALKKLRIKELEHPGRGTTRALAEAEYGSCCSSS